MVKSVKKFYEHKRSYNYADFWTPSGKRFTKKRSHKRLRSQLHKLIQKEE